MICMFLSKDGELRSECRDVQFRYFLIELLQEEVDLVFVGCAGILIRQLDSTFSSSCFGKR